VGDAWRPLWTGRRAPAHWPGADSTLLPGLRWETLRPGVELSALELRSANALCPVRLVLVRVDPARAVFSLEERTRRHGLFPDWNIDRAAGDVDLACDAGQFQGGLPWGWLVRDRREELPPLPAPLAAAVVGDSTGRIEMVRDAEVPARRQRGGLDWAFACYPVLLQGDGDVPAAWQAPAPGIDIHHRDSRLALGWLRDGRLLFLLTRLEAPGPALDRLPFGPTSVETGACLGALGCAQAVMLDGGLSGQLSLRDARGERRRWPGLRDVPVGLVARMTRESR